MPVTFLILAVVGAAAAVAGSVVVFGALLVIAGSVMLGRRRRTAGLALVAAGAVCVAPYASVDIMAGLFAVAVPLYGIGVLIGYWRAPGERGRARRGLRV